MSGLRQLAREIFSETLAAIDIPGAIRQKMVREGSKIQLDSFQIDLSAYDRIVAVAMGKASVAMARGIAGVLGPERPVEGILVAPEDALRDVPGFRTLGAGHPLPDAGSLIAAREILELLHATDSERSLIFFLLSGGGSAMVELPLDPELTLVQLRQLYQLLVECGAPIHEINTVRKHISAVKGGGLAVAARAAMKITLGVSDVPEGCEAALASGPTLPDPTTVADAQAVIERYHLRPKLPLALRKKLVHSAGIYETPKASDPAFANSHFALLLGMADLFLNATRSAESRGCVAVADNSTDDWPVSRAADCLIEKLKALKERHPRRRVAIIAGGELSSPVVGNGVGGRNSAFVLDCVAKIAGKKTTVLSAGTDGRDGSSPAAGAVADGETLARAHAAGLDPEDFFQRSDSHTFFHILGDDIETGPTGNNLRDLRILLAE